MKRCLSARGVAGAFAALAVMALMVTPLGEVFAQAETPPQPQLPAQADPPALDRSEGQIPDQSFADDQALAGPIPAAILQGLNKTTARVSTIRAPIGSVARFGTLEITARACEKKPPTEPPESTAFLEIVDVRPDSPSVAVFTGWMFASSPAISALEHPVYDVWVIDCVQGPGISVMGPSETDGDTAELPASPAEDVPTGEEPPASQ